MPKLVIAMVTHGRIVIALLVILALFFAVPARAQTAVAGKFSFTIGGEAGLVTGFEQTYHDINIDATAMVQYRVIKNLAFTFTTGYSDFISKSYQQEDVVLGGGYYGTPSGNLGLVPFKAGVRIFTDQHFYFSAEGGSWIYTGGYNYYDDTPYLPYGESPPKASHLLAAGGIGWFLNKTDVGFRYDSYSVKDAGYGGTMHYGTFTFHVTYIIK